MTLNRGFRSAARNCLHHAGRAATAAGALLAVSAALTAVPATAATAGPAQPHAAASPSPPASPSPSRVKYYIVPEDSRGQPAVTLYGIASRTLGDGSRFTEIFDLNKGRRQPSGGRLENPQSIHAGWVLQLPPDASGPGVHIGKLPGATGKRHSAPASPRPSGQASTAAQPGTSSGSPMNTMLLLGGILAVFACGVAVEVARRRRATGRPAGDSRAASGSRLASRRAGHARAAKSRVPKARAARDRVGGLLGPAGRSSPLAAATAAFPAGAAATQAAPGTAEPLAPLPVRNRNRPEKEAPGGPPWPDDHPGLPGGRRPARPGDHPSFPGGWPAQPPSTAAGAGAVLPDWNADDPGLRAGRPPAARPDDQPGRPGGRAAAARSGVHQDPASGGPPPGWFDDAPGTPGGWPAQPPARTGSSASAGLPDWNADHPSLPGGQLPPWPDGQWPGAQWAGAQWPDGQWPDGQWSDDHPSMPGQGGAGWAAGLPAGDFPSWPADSAGPQHLAAPVAPVAPAGPRHGGPVSRGPQGTHPYRDPFTADDLQVVLPGPDGRAPRGPAGPGWDGGQGPGPVRSQGGVWDAGQAAGQMATLTRPGAPGRGEQPVRLATKLLAEAGTQAATIRQQASDQAAATIAAARQEGEEIRRQAADQASATLAAAEKAIADRRAEILTMTAELGGMAAYITENLTAPPGTLPPARPLGAPGRATKALPAAPAPEAAAAAGPAALEAGTRSPAKPRPGPAPAAAPPRPARKPPAKPAEGPGMAKGRQVSAMRKSAAVMAALIVIGAATGASEIGLHGLKFFLFRNAGAGAGNSQDLDENQGPGQPGAPGAHHDPLNPPAKGKHHATGRKNHGPKSHQHKNNGNGNGSNGQRGGN